jgi:hypothetical protein
VTIDTGIAWNEWGLGVTSLRMAGTVTVQLHLGPLYLLLAWGEP